MLYSAGRVPMNAFRLLSRPIARPTLIVSRAYATTPPANLNEGERVIWTKLQDKFTPSDLTVMDVSGGCGSFYAINITSTAFMGLPMIKQHRLVNDTLKQEIEGIHGLQLKTTAA